MSRFLFCSLVVLTTSCIANEALRRQMIPPPTPDAAPPLFTGPLLTPSPYVIQVGHYDIEPYVYYGATNADYNSDWGTTHHPNFKQARFQLFLQAGLTKWMDIATIPQVVYSSSQGVSNTNFTDLPVQLDFQIMKDLPGWNWHPAMRFSLIEIFPTGKYEHLDPNKHSTDVGGSGSFSTGLQFVMGKLFHFSGPHFLSTRFAVTGFYSAPTHVKGFNTYGGGYGTSGKVYPGNALNLLFGCEYSMTRNWVVACDVSSTLTAKTRFSGKRGRTLSGAAAQVGGNPSSSLGLADYAAVIGGPSSVRVSLSPAVEYNWNEHLGLIVGSIFSVAGRNSVRFASVAGAFNYYY